MRTITREELKNIGIFDLGEYDSFILGVDINYIEFNTYFLRPAMYECQWFFMNTDIGYTDGYGGEVEGINEDNASKLNAYYIYQQEIEDIFEDNDLKSETIIYIAKTGQTKAIPYLLVE